MSVSQNSLSLLNNTGIYWFQYLESSFSERTNKMGHVTETNESMFTQTQHRSLCHVLMCAWKLRGSVLVLLEYFSCFLNAPRPVYRRNQAAYQLKWGHLNDCRSARWRFRLADDCLLNSKNSLLKVVLSSTGNLNPTINIQFTQQQKGRYNSVQTVGAVPGYRSLR